MKFSEFAKLLQKIENTASRNEMSQDLAGFLKKLDEKEIAPVMYMITGRVVPKFIPLEFNFSEKLLLSSLEKGLDIPRLRLNEMMKSSGDVGSVASEVFQGKSNNDQNINYVYEKLLELARLEGKGSQQNKSNVFIQLLKELEAVSIKYVVRIITGKLRLGLSHKSILDALSMAVTSDKSIRDLLDRAYGFRSDLGLIARLALKGDMDTLEKMEICPGVAVASKLVEREKTIEGVLKRIPQALVQAKYDGLRVQIHYKKGGFDDGFVGKDDANSINLGFDFLETKKTQANVRLFSRNMESLTDMFPDIAGEIQKAPVDSIVLDSEAIGVDASTGKFIPFQETIKRKRKYGIKGKAGDIPVKVFVFDVLYINGVDISQKSFLYRMAILDKLFGCVDVSLVSQFESEMKDLVRFDSKVIVGSNTKLINDPIELKDELDESLSKGLEGLIVKDPQSKYLPGTRNYDWIKLKANMYEELIDTIDCVVLGYFYGKGARAKKGVGAFLVGVYNRENSMFESIAKVGSGVKDEEWAKFVQEVESLKVSEIPKNVSIHKDLVPDVICLPEIVVVVTADEISRSEKHTAGRGPNDKGYSLRFPRLKEWGRVDKSPEEVTSVQEIEDMAR